MKKVNTETKATGSPTKALTTPYRRGVRFERRVMDKLLTEGWSVIRSAGSRGPFDLVAIRSGEVNLVQCKVDGHLSALDGQALLELENELGIPVVLAYRTGHRIVFQPITQKEEVTK